MLLLSGLAEFDRDVLGGELVLGYSKKWISVGWKG